MRSKSVAVPAASQAGPAPLGLGVGKNGPELGTLLHVWSAAHHSDGQTRAGAGAGAQSGVPCRKNLSSPAAARRDGLAQPPVKAPAASVLLLAMLVGHGLLVGEFVGLVFSLPSALVAGSPELGSRRGELSRGLQSICRRI